MPLDGLAFTAVARELKDTIKNARIQGIFQPTPNDLLFHLRQPGHTHRLLISIDPSLARLHLTGTELENPLSPPAFCQLLRKNLVPGRVVEVIQPPFERVLQLVIEARDDSGDATERRLYIEIMGRHSNVVLTRSDGVILDAMKRIPREHNRHRELLPHRAYAPPPAQARLNPQDLDEEKFSRIIRLVPAKERPAKVIADNFAGFSPLAGREVVARAGLPLEVTRDELTAADVHALWSAFQEVMEPLETGRFLPTALITGAGIEFWHQPLASIEGEARAFSSMQELLDWVYTQRAAEAESIHLRQKLAKIVDQHLRRLARKIAAQRDELAKARRADEYRVAGDLLTAYLHQVEPGAHEIELPNFYEAGELVSIALDPTLSPAANAQSYYAKYQKAKKTLAKAQGHLEASLAELEYLESVKAALGMSVSPADLNEIEVELRREGYLPREEKNERRKKRASPSPSSSPLTLTSSDGLPILVGRNNRQNDYLTMEVARSDDLWLHTKEIPGAHVIIQSRGGSIPESTLVEAAHVAAFYSKARESTNVPVDYTLRRHVRKPRGARPGMVIYDHQRTLFVTPDRGLLARLGIPEAGPNDRGMNGTK